MEKEQRHEEISRRMVSLAQEAESRYAEFRKVMDEWEALNQERIKLVEEGRVQADLLAEYKRSENIEHSRTSSERNADVRKQKTESH